MKYYKQNKNQLFFNFLEVFNLHHITKKIHFLALNNVKLFMQFSRKFILNEMQQNRNRKIIFVFHYIFMK